MIGRRDKEVLEELHLFMMQVWNKNARKALPGSIMWEFLSAPVPSEKIERILIAAENSKIVERVPTVTGTDLWKPLPKLDHRAGVE